MRTIYESEDGKTYESEAEAQKADEAYLAKQKKADADKAERKAASQKVTDAYKKAAEANKEARDEMQKFVDKYGNFYMTIHGDSVKDFFNDPFDTFFDFMDGFFRF